MQAYNSNVSRRGRIYVEGSPGSYPTDSSLNFGSSGRDKLPFNELTDRRSNETNTVGSLCVQVFSLSMVGIVLPQAKAKKEWT